MALQQGGKNVKGKPNVKPPEKKEAPKDDKNKKKDIKKKDVKLGELIFEKEPTLNINSSNLKFLEALKFCWFRFFCLCFFNSVSLKMIFGSA